MSRNGRIKICTFLRSSSSQICQYPNPLVSFYCGTLEIEHYVTETFITIIIGRGFKAEGTLSRSKAVGSVEVSHTNSWPKSFVHDAYDSSVRIFKFASSIRTHLLLYAMEEETISSPIYCSRLSSSKQSLSLFNFN